VERIALEDGSHEAIDEDVVDVVLPHGDGGGGALVIGHDAEEGEVLGVVHREPSFPSR